LSAGALEQLPPVPNTVSRCFDLDGNGRHTGHECMGDEERILDVPVDSSAELPFRWISVNWNPAGHHNTPYVQPHFDFHFNTAHQDRIKAIAPRALRRAGGLRRLQARHSSGPGPILPQRLH
jgi:hypothetical protein